MEDKFRRLKAFQGEIDPRKLAYKIAYELNLDDKALKIDDRDDSYNLYYKGVYGGFGYCTNTTFEVQAETVTKAIRYFWFCKRGFVNNWYGFPFCNDNYDSATLDSDIFSILYMYYVLHIKTYSVSLFYGKEPLNPRLVNIVLRELENKYENAEDFLKHALMGPYPKVLFVS